MIIVSFFLVFPNTSVAGVIRTKVWQQEFLQKYPAEVCPLIKRCLSRNKCHFFMKKQVSDCFKKLIQKKVLTEGYETYKVGQLIGQCAAKSSLKVFSKKAPKCLY